MPPKPRLAAVRRELDDVELLLPGMRYELEVALKGGTRDTDGMFAELEDMVTSYLESLRRYKEIVDRLPRSRRPNPATP